MTPTVELGTDALTLNWGDGITRDYPYIWLRDNCPTGFHPKTFERVGDLMEIPVAPRATHAAVDRGEAVIDWQDDGHVSRFALDWLRESAPGTGSADPAQVPVRIWRGTPPDGDLPRHDAQAILSDDGALQTFMLDVAAQGLALAVNVGTDPKNSVALARRIGFLRKTNFGTTFEVINRPDPNNLAYTAERLPLHTDLPNQEVPPGFQFLHCIANEATGGGSLFADGFAIAEDMRAESPEFFALLSQVAIPFRFHDGETDLRVHRPVITLDHAGTVIEIRFNAHIAGVFDMPAEQMRNYYNAYRAYMTRTRDAGYILNTRLQSGEMVVFDNRRILHGRDAFDPSTGFRHLHGCYVDRGEFQARLRLLARSVTA